MLDDTIQYTVSFIKCVYSWSSIKSVLFFFLKTSSVKMPETSFPFLFKEQERALEVVHRHHLDQGKFIGDLAVLLLPHVAQNLGSADLK